MEDSSADGEERKGSPETDFYNTPSKCNSVLVTHLNTLGFMRRGEGRWEEEGK